MTNYRPTESYRVSGGQRRLAGRELKAYADSLHFDQQYAIQRSVTLLRILALPVRITIAEAIKRLHDMLAVSRARAKWGRPWSIRQLERLYFMKPESFKRSAPHPMIEEELRTWKPRMPGRSD